MRTTAHFPGCSSRLARWGLIALAWATASAARAESPMVEGFINTTSAVAWRLYTTAEGQRDAGAAQAQVDFRIGGKMRSHHSADGQLDDAQALVQEVLAYDPQRMLAWRTLQAPSLAAPEALAPLWTVAYFAEAGDMTQVRIVVLGADESPAARATAQALADQQRERLQRLAKDYWPQCALCKAEP